MLISSDERKEVPWSLIDFRAIQKYRFLCEESLTRDPKGCRGRSRKGRAFPARHLRIGRTNRGWYVEESSWRKILGTRGREPSRRPLSTLLPPSTVASCFISDSDASVAAARTLSPPRRTLSSPIKAITLSSRRDNSRMESQKRLRAHERISPRFYNSSLALGTNQDRSPPLLSPSCKRAYHTVEPDFLLNSRLNK